MKRASLLLLLLTALGACRAADIGLDRDDGRLVGAPCASDADCLERCLRDDPRWPAGLCTVANYDFCAQGSSPITLDDGNAACAISCDHDDDCGGDATLICVHDGAVEQWGTSEKWREVFVCEAAR